MTFLTYLSLWLAGFFQAQIYPVCLGDGTVVQIIKIPGHGQTLVHVHENETTALEAAKIYIKKTGGSLITLKHSGQRNIVFKLQHEQYEFDPNRIFTDQGIKQSLTKFGHYSLAAHREVKKLACAILSQLPSGKVIAVHNNRDYSIKEYFPHHSLYGDAKFLNYLENSNYRNFYFVTRVSEYKRLKDLEFNVALQAEKATNDGSLSYFLAKGNYVNIEAAYGQLDAQLAMLFNA